MVRQVLTPTASAARKLDPTMNRFRPNRVAERMNCAITAETRNTTNSIGTPALALGQRRDRALIGIDRALLRKYLGDAVNQGQRGNANDDRIGADRADQ